MVKNAEIVGEALAKVLPNYEKPWYRVPHLLQLNLILIVPLLSSAVAGYDGMLPRYQNLNNEPGLTNADRIDDERVAVDLVVEELFQ